VSEYPVRSVFSLAPAKRTLDRWRQQRCATRRPPQQPHAADRSPALPPPNPGQTATGKRRPLSTQAGGLRIARTRRLDRPRLPWEILFGCFLATPVWQPARPLAGSPRLEAPAGDHRNYGDCCDRPHASAGSGGARRPLSCTGRRGSRHSLGATFRSTRSISQPVRCAVGRVSSSAEAVA
jgi:hypothetical protein